MQLNKWLLASFTTKSWLIWDIFTRRTRCAKASLMKNRMLLRLILLFLFSSSIAQCETHIVLVSSNIFTPSSITIEAGDTVRWINTGGNHNVFANDGSFRCAQGCEADGGDGSPSPMPWVAEVTFREIGIVNYHCQPHLQFGMVGSVTVVEPQNVAIHEVHTSLNNDFTPNDLSIMRGDVVRFINDGGLHNIHSDDDSLICSETCIGDGINRDTAPTGFPWDIYVKFNEIGDIPYYCEAHEMTGTPGIIRVYTDTLFENGFEL